MWVRSTGTNFANHDGAGIVCIIRETFHDDVIKWKYFPHYWLFVRGTTGRRWIPLTRPVTRRFDAFFDLQMIQQTILRRRWLEIPSRSLWRHWNASPALHTNRSAAKPPVWLIVAFGWRHMGVLASQTFFFNNLFIPASNKYQRFT